MRFAKENEAAEVERFLLESASDLERYLIARLPPRYRPVIAVEDIMQEVWISAFERGFMGVEDRAHWLLTLANSRLVDCIRSLRALKRGGKAAQLRLSAIWNSSSMLGLIPHVSDTPSRVLARKDAVQTMTIAIAQLTEDERRVVQLRYFQGLSHEAIAEAMGKSAAAVNSLLFRALQRLRGHIDRLTHHPDGKSKGPSPEIAGPVVHPNQG